MTDQHRPRPHHELTEDQLRDLLHRAVATVQPEPGALPRLRTAVPRRRAARRRAWSGAAVLAGAAAVLPLVHAAQPFHLSGDPTGGQAAGEGHAAVPDSSAAAPGHPHGLPTASVTGADGTGSETTADPSADGSPGASPAVPPLCTRADFGRVDAQQADAIPADGRIYGWFRLTNTSDHPCRVTDPGVLDLGTGATGVRLAAHTVGDPAGALPDPAGLPRELLLGPGGSYLVRFAWVPARCDTPPPVPSSRPTLAPSSAGLPGAGTPAEPAPAAVAADPSPTGEPAPGGTPGPSSPATFALGYIPDRSARPAATAALPVGCGGTVYHTPPEPAPAPGGPAPSSSAAP
ncbi:hypothetical protein [Kitasatospora sp. CB01950]|uniref:hypothetical protein n=1 Tax=Kitasatospora sp. CB01950 TaxID=1703930 RepID=UPI0009401D92|nr:hypothetical protein [Kitasatospora sp. CB01950]OKJ16858.1 hypothetical protein AMK19_01510 [Kitasatospora sp. CB01950]